jgi:Mrp family chromosome partitioning ATPase
MISNKMLTLGRPVLERLATTLDHLIPDTTTELVICGTNRGVGTSTIAVSLARLYAERGERVLLVDADIHKAGITHSLELIENRSWVTLVRGASVTDTGILKTRESKISFATISPLRLRTIWPPYVLDHLANLLSTLTDVFDRILIDVGPVNQLTAEMSGNQSLATAALVVAEVGNADEETTGRIRRNLAGVGIDQVLFAQNFAKQS